MSSRQAHTAQAARRGPPPPSNAQMLTLGKLSFLASFCPLHRTYPGHVLASIFIPAVNNGCVRLFENEQGATAAALIWARLSDDVSARMLSDGRAPTTDEWAAGDTLWFIDLLAPYRLHHAQQQRSLAARIGTLRERLRPHLGESSGALARLARTFRRACRCRRYAFYSQHRLLPGSGNRLLLGKKNGRRHLAVCPDRGHR